MSTSYDNRETCGTLLPSSCIPYTGQVNTSIEDNLPCRPNINDILKNIQNLIDKINNSLGDNTTLDPTCLTFTPSTVTQVQLNQLLITEICELKTAVQALQQPIDPDTINIAINLLCLVDPGCTPQTEYTLTEILVKLVTAYCDLLTRVTTIENILNI